MDTWPKTLTKNQRRRVARYECGWCEQRCDRGTCGGIYDKCSEETRRTRAADCLNASRSPGLRDHNL